MALSFSNTCRYPNCGLNFISQHQLIIHIENAHVDFNPKIIEEAEKNRFELSMVPPSYVLKYNLNNELFPCDISIKEESIEDEARFSSDFRLLDSYGSMLRYNTDNIIVKVEPLEFKGLPISDNYIKTTPDKSFIISQGGKKRIPPISENGRKFACPVSGCNKKYKNINGARYHTKHCHDSFGNLIKPKKDYHCACGKQYKTASGLRNHLQVHSDKNNHGVILANIDGNDINQNILPQQILTLCPPNASTAPFGTVGCLSGNSVGGQNLRQMKCNCGIVDCDKRIRIFGCGHDAKDIPNNFQIRCDDSEYLYGNKTY